MLVSSHSEDRYVIERDGSPLAVIVAEPHGYVVYACSNHIWPLDHKVFESLDEAKRHIIGSAEGSRLTV